MAGYRVMVVNTGDDNMGIVLKKMSENDLIPYDGLIHGWPEACKLRYEAMEFYPAVIIEAV